MICKACSCQGLVDLSCYFELFIFEFFFWKPNTNFKRMCSVVSDLEIYEKLIKVIVPDFYINSAFLNF